jgi:hypothetical protein
MNHVRQALTIAVVTAATALPSGCSSGLVAPEAGGTAAATPDRPASSPPAAGATVEPVELVLSDQGVGKLRLGMSRSAAQASGLLGRKEDENSLCVTYTGRQGVKFVYFVAGRVSIIDVDTTIPMTAGLRITDTYADLHALFPTANPNAGAGGIGHLELSAPAAPRKAHYRVGISDTPAYPDTKITEIALQSDDQSCYE